MTLPAFVLNSPTFIILTIIILLFVFQTVVDRLNGSEFRGSTIHLAVGGEPRQGGFGGGGGGGGRGGGRYDDVLERGELGIHPLSRV